MSIGANCLRSFDTFADAYPESALKQDALRLREDLIRLQEKHNKTPVTATEP